MIDRAIWSGAVQVHRQYGDKAVAIAQMRLTTLLAEGDRMGHDVWCEIYNVLTVIAPARKSMPTLH